MPPLQAEGDDHLTTKGSRCEWCVADKRDPPRKAVMVVNLPGNALKTRVCRECFNKQRDEDGQWEEICYRCGGSGDLGDDFSPCPDCDAEGYQLV